MRLAASLLPGGSALAEGVKVAGKGLKIAEAVKGISGALGDTERV